MSMKKGVIGKSGLLDGWVYDSIFIFGTAAIALFSGAIVLWNPALFFPVMLADLWLLGYHHVITTFTKLAGTKKDRQENWFLIYILPFIVLGAVFSLYALIGVWSIVSVYFFWQWFHYTRQSYGVSVFYRRKAKQAAENEWLGHLAIWSIPVWGILHRCAQGWDEFLFLPIKLPDVPDQLVFLAGVGALGSTLWWLWSRVEQYQKGQLSLGQTYFTFSHMVIFYVGYVAISEINVGWLVANIWHNAQYILFVWLYNTKRFVGLQPVEGRGTTVMQVLSQRQPIRVILYFCFTMATTTVVYQGLSEGFKAFAASNAIVLSTLYIIGYQTINFHHYVVDGLIWKAKNRQNQQVLGVGGVSPSV